MLRISFITLPFWLLLAAIADAQTKYDPTQLPKGHDYFELRDGLSNCQRRFSQDKTGRVVFLGGSITAGGAWRQHTCDYLTRKFPETRFEFINAGIGSLGSVPHAFRLERDVLSKGPVDLLFVEAAVNDSSNTGDRPDLMLRGMEGIVRHLRLVSPLTDIIQLHFVMEPHMDDYNAGRIPHSIAQHERVAVVYGNPSLNLSREVTDRIQAGEFTWAADFKNLHPSPFGHQLYANSVARMLDAAFANPVASAAKNHPLPEPIDGQSFWQGRLGNIAEAKSLQAFQHVAAWAPPADEKQADGKKVGVRDGFVNVPALIGTQPGAEFEFAFEGRGCGLFITAGPDAADIEFRIDGGAYRKATVRKNLGLHLPRAVILDDQLQPGSHTVQVRIANSSTNTASGLRVFHLLLN
jgi:lysophospholipase L1-like esterase